MPIASFLQRLGRLAFHRRRAVLGAWLGLLVATVAAAALAGGSFSASFSVPGTESQRANDLLAQQAPATTGAGGGIAFAAPAGNQPTAAAGGTPAGAHRVQAADELGGTRRAPAASAADAAGSQVGTTGEPAAQNAPGGGSEGLGVAVALLVLVVTFGSMLAAGMPLLTAAVGVGIGLTGVMAMSAVTELSSAVISLAAMLGLAVGIDYALFIITRYRTLVRQGMSLPDAAGRAVGTAGTAVVFAGSTVVIALVALLVTGVPFLAAMGLAAAVTVAIAVLIAVTLVPALLGFAGPRALKGHRSERADRAPTTMGLRWVSFVARHRAIAIGGVVLTTLALAVPVTHMRLGLPDDSSGAPATAQSVAAGPLARDPGRQLTVVAELPAGTGGKAAVAAIRARLTGLDDVASVAPAQVLPGGRLAVIGVTPSSGPSSVATEGLVSTIRDQRAALTQGTGAQLSVTGQAAISMDVANTLGAALVPYLAVIVGLAFLLLTIAFRSLLVPLTAVGGFLLSIAAALGAMVGVFQDGFGAGLLGVSTTGPIVSLTPVLIIGILFGLAMDYQMFLVSGMKEARAHGAAHQDAVRTGFRHSARVVTAAGLIMVSVFAGFIIPDDAIIKSVGFALAAGVLIDAFLIRMTLIPALMSLIGEHAWWLPRRLERLVPNVDIEGAKLSAAPIRPRPAPQAA